MKYVFLFTVQSSPISLNLLYVKVLVVSTKAPSTGSVNACEFAFRTTLGKASGRRDTCTSLYCHVTILSDVRYFLTR